ncbi:hypothetical protein, partial [Burkholderia cenocepacia]|uniref:hypothetical protein n=1 Tax=Burkholderia cenocepacia TaxID=95486 RepID=UPI001F4AD4FE
MTAPITVRLLPSSSTAPWLAPACLAAREYGAVCVEESGFIDCSRIRTSERQRGTQRDLVPLRVVLRTEFLV